MGGASGLDLWVRPRVAANAEALRTVPVIVA